MNQTQTKQTAHTPYAYKWNARKTRGKEIAIESIIRSRRLKLLTTILYFTVHLILYIHSFPHAGPFVRSFIRSLVACLICWLVSLPCSVFVWHCFYVHAVACSLFLLCFLSPIWTTWMICTVALISYSVRPYWPFNKHTHVLYVMLLLLLCVCLCICREHTNIWGLQIKIRPIGKMKMEMEMENSHKMNPSHFTIN